MLREQRQQAAELAELAAEFLKKGGLATVCPPGSAIREVEQKRPSLRKNPAQPQDPAKGGVQGRDESAGQTRQPGYDQP